MKMGYIDEFETIQYNEFKKYKMIAEKAMEDEDYPTAADAFLKAGRAMEKLAKVTENEKLREKRLSSTSKSDKSSQNTSESRLNLCLHYTELEGGKPLPLLSELDGLQDKDSSRYILTMAATNTPWDIDKAVLSRFPKRIHIPLPDKEACREIIKIHTFKEGLEFDEQILEQVADKCNEKLFAGRDIATLCNNAIWNMVRSENPTLSNLADKPIDAIRKYKLKTRELTIEDFEKSFESMESAVKEHDLEKYERWAKEYGSG